MRRQPVELIHLNWNWAKPAMLVLPLFFFVASSCFASSSDLTIAEYNLVVQKEKALRFHLFKADWFSYLRRKSSSAPKNATPSDARQATEDFLIRTGGLKARFALASRNNSYGFTLSRPSDEKTRLAGFHRSRKSIFIDLDQTNSNEWLMIFVHEVAHSLDSELVDSMPIYNNPERAQRIAFLAAKHTDLHELTVQDQTLLKEWLLAGLNRGFLAEYRAWLLTYLIYEEGLKDGTFQPIEWLEEIRNRNAANADARVYIFRYLSPFWADPTDGLFSHQIVKQALAELRSELLANPTSVKLGAIGSIISN